MKQLIMPVLLATGLLLTVSGFSQQAVKVDQSFDIELTDQLLQQKYVALDISGLQFKNEIEAQKFFKSIANNLVEFNLDYASKKATMVLFPERTGNHVYSLEDWNVYIDNMSSRCSSTYNSFLNQ